jgi:hypothetical protein
MAGPLRVALLASLALLVAALTGCTAGSTCLMGGACSRGTATWLQPRGSPNPPKLFHTQSESIRLYGRQ